MLIKLEGRHPGSSAGLTVRCEDASGGKNKNNMNVGCP